MAHDRKFRFGVQTGGADSAKAWREKVHQIEELGYSTLFMPDHFIDTPFAPMVGISLAAEATTTLRVGHLVLGNDYKHPAVVAKEIATLDLATDGRVECGLGAGWMKTDYDALGLPYDSPGTRIVRLDEALQVVKGCWGDGPFSFEGEHYTIRDYDGIPKPAQQPRPPIVVGGGGPRLLRLAGREADIVGVNPNLRAGEVSADAAQTARAEETDRKIAWIQEGAGERFDDLEIQIRYFLGAITDDARGFADAIAPAFGLDAEEALASAVACVGDVDEVCDLLVERRERWHASYVIFGDDSFEAFAPVVARLAGT